jgi:hypothetical protein
LAVKAAAAAFTALLMPRVPDSEIRPAMRLFCGVTRSNDCSLPSAILPSTKEAKMGSVVLVMGELSADYAGAESAYLQGTGPADAFPSLQLSAYPS